MSPDEAKTHRGGHAYVFDCETADGQRATVVKHGRTRSQAMDAIGGGYFLLANTGPNGVGRIYGRSRRADSPNKLIRYEVEVNVDGVPLVAAIRALDRTDAIHRALTVVRNAFATMEGYGNARI